MRDIHDRIFQLALQITTLREDSWFREMASRELLRQLVRAGTSTGANMTEASVAQSKPDFVAKVGISRKEIAEAQFWLRLGRASGLLSDAEAAPLQTEAAHIGRIISAIARKARTSSSRGAEPTPRPDTPSRPPVTKS